MAMKGKATIGLREARRMLDDVCRALPNIAVFAGESEHLRSDAAARYREAWLARWPDGDVVVLRGRGEAATATPGDLARELSGGSLFAKEKLVLVRQAERILFPTAGRGDADDAGRGDAPSAKERDKAFLDCLDNPPKTIWLAVETASLPQNRTLGKRLAAAGDVVPCPNPTLRDVPAWLSARAGESGKRLDDEAMDLLAQAHGADLGALAREVDKLALFVGDGELIDGNTVREFLTGTIEFEVFGFTNAIEERDLDKALTFARRIAVQGTRDQKGKREDGKTSVHKVLALLANTVQGLLRAGVARSRKLSAAEFAAEEKLNPWRAGRLLEAAGRFKLPELRHMTVFAADQIRRAHDTGSDPLLALELMAVKFAARER